MAFGVKTSDVSSNYYTGAALGLRIQEDATGGRMVMIKQDPKKNDVGFHVSGAAHGVQAGPV